LSVVKKLTLILGHGKLGSDPVATGDALICVEDHLLLHDGL